MESLFSEWLEWHKCFFFNNCGILDIPDAVFTINLVVAITDRAPGAVAAPAVVSIWRRVGWGMVWSLEMVLSR